MHKSNTELEMEISKLRKELDSLKKEVNKKADKSHEHVAPYVPPYSERYM